MRVLIERRVSFLGAALVSVLVASGVLASLGFRQQTQSTDYVGYTGTAPTQAGHCVEEVMTPENGIVLVNRNAMVITGKCENGITCSAVVTCQATSNFTVNPLANGCPWAKTVSSVLVGSCDTEVVSKQCAQCNHRLVCHVYELFESRDASGTCNLPCARFLVKYGGSCVYNGTP